MLFLDLHDDLLTPCEDADPGSAVMTGSLHGEKPDTMIKLPIISSDQQVRGCEWVWSCSCGDVRVCVCSGGGVTGDSIMGFHSPQHQQPQQNNQQQRPRVRHHPSGRDLAPPTWPGAGFEEEDLPESVQEDGVRSYSDASLSRSGE